MLQRRRNIRFTGSAGPHPSERPLARRNHVRVSDYYAGPPDDLSDRDFSFPLPVHQVAVRASTDGIAAA